MLTVNDSSRAEPRGTWTLSVDDSADAEASYASLSATSCPLRDVMTGVWRAYALRRRADRDRLLFICSTGPKYSRKQMRARSEATLGCRSRSSTKKSVLLDQTPVSASTVCDILRQDRE